MFHDVEQNSEEWLELRKGKVTASYFPIIMANDGKAFGEPAKRYALKLALERKTGRRIEAGFSNEHTERGHALEPVARMRYESEYFTQITNGGFFDLVSYGDSPDGLICQDGVIEIKSVIASTHYETLNRNAPDPAYKWQIVGHLFCTKRKWCEFVSYCEDFPEEKQLLVYRIYAEEIQEKFNRLETRLNEFLEYILKIESTL